MKCPQLLFVCWCSSILAVSSCITVDKYSCVSAYWDKVECELNITGDPVAQSNANYSLKFTRDEDNTIYTCPLILKEHTYGCVCKVHDREILRADIQYNVQLCNNSSCHSLIKGFCPSKNIQLTPPKEVEVQQTPNVFNITWKSGYENHKYFRSNALQYELLLQKSPNSKSQKHHLWEAIQTISRSQLDADATYCTRVRSKPSKEGYQAIWSKWSPQICWKNEVQKVDKYSCVSAYWDKVECELNITGDPVAQSNANYSLKFTRDEDNTIYTCPLILKEHTYGCVCKVHDREILRADIQYNVQLCNNSSCRSLIKEFCPSKNIQLTPPKEVEVQQTPNFFNITWKSGYENHKYFRSTTALQYELLLQKSPNSKSQKHHLWEAIQTISRSQLDADATYCTRVRSKPSVKDYQAIWSKWSPQICWKNEVQKEQENIIMTLTRSLVPVCVIVGVLLLVFHIPAARMKIKTLSHTPSPAPFFQPLFQQHEGNLKEWLSPQGKFALTYKTDEILITDAVTVEPKPKTKDPEENQNVCNTAVTQLTFPQCQTSYVGLPGMHMAPQLTPITTICPAGDTPYTRLPGSVWGFSIREEPVMLSPPQHVFKSSCSDSGCSFEDLTQSPECSLPNSPVEASSPPRYCKDYCILNKTAEGVVPVLVSK